MMFKCVIQISTGFLALFFTLLVISSVTKYAWMLYVRFYGYCCAISPMHVLDLGLEWRVRITFQEVFISILWVCKNI